MNKCPPPMLRLSIALLLAIFSTLPAAAQQPFRVATYNVENLFDTIPNPTTADDEFLPEGSHHWGSQRYRGKLARLSRVVAALGGTNPVSVLALCEVETDSVVADLCRKTQMRRLGYEYIVTHSLDRRGINVALLYQPLEFGLIAAESFRIPTTKSYGRHTRDILHVSGRLAAGDTLDVFVCHWPSRRGSSRSAEKFRNAVADSVRQKVDSISRRRTEPLILIMGDFNDDYTSASISDHLRAVPASLYQDSDAASGLYVLSADLKAHDGIEGTYRFRDQWNQLDQIIVNGGLLRRTSPSGVDLKSCRIFAPSFLLRTVKKTGEVQPYRTFLGPVYVGGFSDHLPLVADFFF